MKQLFFCAGVFLFRSHWRQSVRYMSIFSMHILDSRMHRQWRRQQKMQWISGASRKTNSNNSKSNCDSRVQLNVSRTARGRKKLNINFVFIQMNFCAALSSRNCSNMKHCAEFHASPKQSWTSSVFLFAVVMIQIVCDYTQFDILFVDMFWHFYQPFDWGGSKYNVAKS